METLGQAPPNPLHPNCRCLFVPVTKTWRELGLDIDEIEDVYRPYTLRTNTKSRKIIEVGFNKGDFSTFFQKQSPAFQRNMIGPKRLALLKDKKIMFKNLVNTSSGDLFTLKELEENIVEEAVDYLEEVKKFKKETGLTAVSDQRVKRLIDKCFID